MIKKNSGNSTRVLLFGGLGNQLFQIAAGLCEAGEGKLFLDTSLVSYEKNTNWFRDYEKLAKIPNVKFDQNRKLHWFSRRLIGLAIRNSERYQEITNSHKNIISRRRILEKLLELLIFKGNQIYISNGLGFNEICKSSKRESLHIGYFQSYKWIESNDKVLEKIRFMVGVEKELDGIERKTLLQIRLGDFVGSSAFVTLGKLYITRALKEANLTNSNDTVFVFSDNPLAASQLLAEIPNMNFLFDDKNSGEPIRTLRSMALYKQHIISSSTFGYWGAILATKCNLVLAPSPWFLNKSEPTDLIPKGWRRIER